MPPFPDTSPKSTERPFAQPRALCEDNNFTPALGTLSTTTQVPANVKTQVSEPPSGQKPNMSSPLAHDYNRTSSHSTHPESNQEALHPRSKKGERNHMRHPPQVLSMERMPYSKRESADATQNHMANQPLTDWTHVRPSGPTHRARPVSRGSNVSKQRSRCGSLASSPMIRQRRVNISHEFTTSMAGVINQFTHKQNSALEEQKEKYHKYIKRLRKELDTGSSTIEAQTGEIKGLEALNEQLAGQLHDLTTKLGVSDDRAQKLEEKYKTCKAHLNKAITEHQDFYSRSKKRCEDAVEEIRGMEQSQIAEKDVELRQERESVRALAQQLQDLQATSSSFEALVSQGNEILSKLSEQQEKSDDEHRKLTEDTRTRLDALTTRLEALSNATTDQSALLSGIREARDASLQSASDKLDQILESRDEARDATGRLSTHVEHQLGEIWQRLDSQIESLTGRLEEKAEENGMVATLFSRQVAECKEHIREVEELRESTEKQTHRIQELEANLATLDVAQDEHEEITRRLEAQQTEMAQLRDAIKSKEAAMDELQSTLDTRQREHSVEVEKCNREIQQLSQTLREQGAKAQEAVAAARHEARAEMEGANASTMKLLGESQQQMNSLVDQLESLKQENQIKEQSGLQDTATIRSLREALTAEEAQREATAGQLAQRSRDLEELEVRFTSTVNGLKAQLDSSRDRAVELEGESRRQRARYEGLIAGLKLWAQQAGLIIHDLDCLGEVNNSTEDISAGLVEALSRMSRGENLVFSSSRQPWQGDSRNQPGVDQPANDHAGAAVGENEPGHDPLSYASSLHHTRRVVVCSPANVPDEPAIPSVDQEKARRREALQPKGILKRVTRSTSDRLREAPATSIAGNGSFRRTKQERPAGRHASTEATPNAGEAGVAESINVAPSKRPSKRRRSETAKPDHSLDAIRAPRQWPKPEPLGSHEGHRQDQATNGSRGFQPGPILDSQRNSGAATGLHRTTSGNPHQALRARQPNVRTYGSQRPAEPPTPGSQFHMRSQSQSQAQSRYWARPKDESQESMKFSQNVGDENMLVSF
ncbi:hypothetical protein C8A05DRAFT_12913 [Staphylotrichum tortipilum]|uniref:Uncharacterized protein n=1 Tax=Staphylotrichum tortipilum TaxID=2831512 RepID=A0AAN6MQX0_9PEZI|nr:hypothetical protein C8A05DRAFT_12913 [Staphylotrichum longicolle]